MLKTSFEKVWILLKKYYPDSHQLSYISTWLELLSYKRIPKNKHNMIIRIKKIYEKDEKKYWYHVNGINKEYSDGCALNFNSFREWLSYYIAKDVLKKYTTEEILAHCLWEMAFNGYSSKDILKTRRKLFGMCNKALNKEFNNAKI